jgi:hypothetical protein
MRKQTKSGKVSIEEFVSAAEATNAAYRKFTGGIFLGEEVNMSTLNLRMHLHKGFDCIECGAKGSYLKVERTPGPPHIIYSDWHLNLYAVNATGEEVLMTKDHRYPRSKGGSDEIENLDPMCSKCNHKKGDKI